MSRRETVCPRDCPRRSAVPNCHDPERCDIWAAHLERMRVVHAARAQMEAERACVTHARRQADRRRERDVRRGRR